MTKEGRGEKEGREERKKGEEVEKKNEASRGSFDEVKESMK